MTRRKLDKLREELARLRRSPQKARAIEGLAKRLGRKPYDRGKEPVWVSKEFEYLFPIAIPRHGGRDLAKGTQNSILDLLENDILEWEQRIEEEERRTAEKKRKNGK